MSKKLAHWDEIPEHQVWKGHNMRIIQISNRAVTISLTQTDICKIKSVQKSIPDDNVSPELDMKLYAATDTINRMAEISAGVYEGVVERAIFYVLAILLTVKNFDLIFKDAALLNTLFDFANLPMTRLTRCQDCVALVEIPECKYFCDECNSPCTEVIICPEYATDPTSVAEVSLRVP